MPSQGKQDEWVLQVLAQKRNGFFLDIGAGHPVENSNTHLLRRDYDWTGIVVEPRLDMYQKWLEYPTCANCVPVHGCMIGRNPPEGGNGKLVEFCLNTKIPDHSSVFGEFPQPEHIQKIHVPSWRPFQLLKTFEAPSVIDYVSLDTEGNELSILESFPFMQRKIRCLTVEHNQCEPVRRGIERALRVFDMIRVTNGPAECYWDDFYVNPSLI
jgi:FkbM family methyltransferase